MQYRHADGTICKHRFLTVTDDLEFTHGCPGLAWTVRRSAWRQEQEAAAEMREQMKQAFARQEEYCRDSGRNVYGNLYAPGGVVDADQVPAFMHGGEAIVPANVVRELELETFRQMEQIARIYQLPGLILGA